MNIDLQTAQAFSTLFVPRYNAEFYFGLTAFLLSLTVGTFYIIDWVRNHRREREHTGLLWGSGLFLGLWFQIPFLYANAGFKVVATDFHPLFSIMLPMCFLGSLLIYRGVCGHLGGNLEKLDALLGGWFVLCCVYFVYYYYEWQYLTSYVPLVLGGVLFFLIIFGLLLTALVRWYRQIVPQQYPYTLAGIILFVVAVLLQLGAATSAALSILQLSPEFWFLAIMSSPTAFVLQSVSTAVLVIGMHYIHREQAPHGLMDQLRVIKSTLKHQPAIAFRRPRF